MTKRIQENLVATSMDKIKMLTREDIMTSGKTKGIILDSAALQLLPPEDPRRQVSDVDMVAKAAAERLFEISVTIRRAKKEKLQKLEDEAQARATEEHPAQPVSLDTDAIDGMIYMLDYPQTKDEAFALARHSYSISGVFEVNEVPKSDAEDAEEDEDAEGQSDEGDDDEEK